MKLATIVMTTCALVGFAAAQKPIRVKIDNEVVAFDAEPMEVRGVTMVPIRSMIDSMGGTMRWDLSRQTVSAWKNSNRFDIVLNSRSAVVNDKPRNMDEAAIIYKNRIYAPLKFLADAAGYVISLDSGWYVLKPVRK